MLSKPPFVNFINVAIAGLSFLTAIADVATRLQLLHKEDLVAGGTCMVCTFTLASQLAGCCLSLLFQYSALIVLSILIALHSVLQHSSLGVFCQLVYA